MTTLWTVLAAVLIFCVLIFVHEFGHFISAKLLGIRVHEFAIGMGPKIFSRKKGETLYSVRMIPIGGFCALEGEDSSSDDAKALSNKPAWVKLIVLAAGSFMNLLLGFLLLICMYASASGIVVPEVASVAPESHAAISGVQVGDEIVSFGGKRIHIAGDLFWEKTQAGEGPIELKVLRDGKTVSLTLAPQSASESLGIGLKARENNFFLTVKTGFYQGVFYGRVIIETFFDLLQGKVAISSMSGPIGIVSEIGSAVQETAQSGWAGFLNLLELAVLLTINLGVFNLLPVPALDGGRIFFVLVSIITRRKIPPEKEGMVHFIGFALLILLSIFIAYMDVLRLF